MQQLHTELPRRSSGARSLSIHGIGGIFGTMRTPLLASLAIIAASLAAPAHADGLRCGSRLIRDGDARAEVRAFCGEPADVQTKTILRRPSGYVGGRFVYFSDSLVEVNVEIWTFNFGPNKLMRRVKFVDGIVNEVETLGYGYNDPNRGTYGPGS